MSTGPIPNKVVIQAFTEKELDNPKPSKKFILPINPEQHAQALKQKYDTRPAQGTTSVEEHFQSSEPEELKLDFILDGTGTVYGYEKTLKDKSVPDQIKALKDVVYTIDGGIHRPNYLKVLFSEKVTFDCILTDLEITYTLFSPDGKPLRAKVSCTFLSYKEDVRRVSEENKSSPDLTHVRDFTESDTLPLMVNTIYGDPALYLEVARVNGLTNFRRVAVGTRLIFPPVDKSTS